MSWPLIFHEAFDTTIIYTKLNLFVFKQKIRKAIYVGTKQRLIFN